MFEVMEILIPAIEIVLNVAIIIILVRRKTS